MNDTTHRPFGVAFLSILIIVVGVLQAIGGAIVLADRNDAEIANALDVTSSDVTTIGVVAIVLGIIGVLVGSALRGGANWARVLVALIAVANFVTLVWAAISYSSLHWFDVTWPAVVYGAIAGYLFFDDDAKRYFA